jgi:hypothetical protein
VNCGWPRKGFDAGFVANGFGLVPKALAGVIVEYPGVVVGVAAKDIGVVEKDAVVAEKDGLNDGVVGVKEGVVRVEEKDEPVKGVLVVGEREAGEGEKDGVVGVKGGVVIVEEKEGAVKGVLVAGNGVVEAKGLTVLANGLTVEDGTVGATETDNKGLILGVGIVVKLEGKDTSNAVESLGLKGLLVGEKKPSPAPVRVLVGLNGFVRKGLTGSGLNGFATK